MAGPVNPWRASSSAVLSLALASAAGCGKESAATGAASASAPAPFQLVCDSSDTSTSSTLFCMRIDTRTGDVRTVDLAKLPTSNGPTASAPGPAGTYDLVCDSTDTATHSEFRCVRFSRQTGEAMIIKLPKVGIIPE